MKSFKNFITEAEEVPDIVRPKSIQSSLPGLGRKSIDKKYQVTNNPDVPARYSQVDPKQALMNYATELETRGVAGGRRTPEQVKLSPEEIKRRTADVKNTFAAADKGDAAALERLKKYQAGYDKKYSVPEVEKPKPTTSTKNTPQGRAADAQFRTELELDTPQGADAAQQAAKDMAADARTGNRKPRVNSASSSKALMDLSRAVDTVSPEPQLPRIRGVVARTQTGAPITTSTTRTSTNPAPAPAPQRAVTAAIDSKRQSAAASTPDAVKKQNAAVMGSAARTLGRGLSAYSGYNTGVQRGEGTQGALVRGIGAAAATDALSAAAYRMLPKPLKTVGAVVTHAASQKGVNSLITVLRQQLGMK